MISKIPNNVWLLDDNINRISNFNKYLEGHLDAEKEPNEVLNWFKKCNTEKNRETFIPDLLILDICLRKGEDLIVQVPQVTMDNLKAIANVSGIKLLTWLRCEWPKLPIVVISSYWQGQLPSLSQHAICVLHPDQVGYKNVVEIIWLAQTTIIGVRLTRNVKERSIETINKINNLQNHFFFILFENEDDLIAPPIDLFSEELFTRYPSLLFEVWNNRIAGIIDEVSLEKSFHPILPFGRKKISYFSACIQREIEFMGDSYLVPYLLRECAHAAFSSCFNIKPHPIATGECIFDSSTYPPDLLKGIKRGELCPECKSQMLPHHAYGGWSKGRNEAANKICMMAKDSLNAIKEFSND